MGLQSSDNVMISRGGTLYKVLGSDILAYVQANVGTSEYKVANIAARNALDSTLSAGDRVMVDDATGDATVTAGWALYQWISSGSWRKIAEQESIDVSISAATNLSFTAAPTQGTVVSDTGNDATLPAVDGTNAGLMLPAHKVKLDYVTITQAVDLDAVEAASHAAVTLAGSTNNNPITMSGQQLGFSIANLTTAP